MKPEASRNEPECDARAQGAAALPGQEHYWWGGDPSSTPHKHQIDCFQLEKNIKTQNMHKSARGEMYYPAVTTGRESWGLWVMHTELLGSGDPASQANSWLPPRPPPPPAPQQPSSCHRSAAFCCPALTHSAIFLPIPHANGTFCSSRPF